MPENAPPPSPRRSRKHWVLALKVGIPLLLVAGVVGYRWLTPVPAVEHHVERGELVMEVFGRGTVESRREANLAFDLVGRVSDVLVDEGDRVELGQEVAHLAPEQVEADIRTARSGVDATRASLRRIDADERRAEAMLEFATIDEARMRELASSGATAGRDLDIAVQQTRLAVAEIARVRAARTEVRRAVTVAAGNVEQRQVVALRSALIAPFDGLVVRRFRDPGDTVAVASTVLRVVATDRLWVRAWIDESVLARLAEEQATSIRFPGLEEPLSGRVDRIGREADRQTHEVLVDVVLDEIPERVAIGQRADVVIETSRHDDVVAIPLEFIKRAEDRIYVFISESGRIRSHEVQLGLVGRETVQVTEGLSNGDVVLRAPVAGQPLPEGRRHREPS